MPPSPAPPETSPPGRFRRVLGGIVWTIGVGVLFLGSALSAVVLHLDQAPTRRVVQRAVNELLGTLFQGRILAEEIDRITLHGVDIRSAIVLDPEGVQIIRASGIHGRANVLGLAKDALFGSGELLIDLPLIQVDDASVLVEPSPGKRLPSVVDTFVLRGPSTPPLPGARPLRVLLRRIELSHAWAHGMLARPRMLDADVSRLAASIQVGDEGVALDVEQTGLVDRALLPWVTAGTAKFHLRLAPAPAEGAPSSAPPPPQLRTWMGFSGQVAQVQVQARATLDDGRLAGTVEVPRATPDEVASIVPGLALRESIGLRADIDGTIPTFSLSGDVTVEGKRGTVAFDGRLDASGPTVLELDLAANELDPGVLVAVAASPVEVTARLRAELGATLRMAVEARTSPFALGGTALPAAEIQAIFDHDRWLGSAQLDDQGLPIDATFGFNARDGLAFTAAAEIHSIRGAPRLPIPIDGAARLHVEGTLRAGFVDARVRGLFSGVRAPGEVAIGYGGLDGRINGPIAQPDAIDIDASLWGQELRAVGYGFETLRARARGSILHPHVETDLYSGPRDGQGDAIHASGDVDPATKGLRRIAVTIRRDRTEIGGTIARISAQPGGVGIEGITLDGAGVAKINGGLVVRGGELSGKVHGDGVDLARMAQLLGIRQPIKGIAAFDVDLQPTRKGRKGHAQIEIENGEYALLHGVSALLDLRFDDDKVTTDGLVRVLAHDAAASAATDRCEGSIAMVRLDGGSGILDGRLLDRRTWEHLAGKVQISAEDWDLGCISEMVPLSLIARAVPGAVVPSEIKGKVTTRFVVDRPEARRFPSVRELTLRTNNLQVIGPPSTEPDRSGPAWASTDVDLQIKGDFEGDGHIDTSLTLYDGGILVDASLQTTLDLPTLIDRPAERWASLRKAPLEGRISIPRREVSSFSTLPSFVRERIPPLAGEVRIDGYLDGNLERPFAALRIGGFGLAYAPGDAAASGAWLFPLDLESLFTYDAAKIALDAHLIRNKTEVAGITGEATLPLPELLARNFESWTGGFHVTLHDAPIGEIPFFADRDIGGHLSGTIGVGGLHTQPTVDVKLDAPDLKIGQELFFDEGTLAFVIKPRPGADKADDHALGVLTLGLESQDGGRLDASAFAGIRWANGITPDLDREATADLYAKLKGFRLATLHPMISDLLSKLDGNVDGEVRVGWQRLAASKRGTVEAKLTLRNGVIHVPQLGQELHGAEVRIESEPERALPGGGVELAKLRLDNIRAEGTRGLVTGKAVAHLDGLIFHDAEAALSIAPGNALPLTLEGVPMGMASGEIQLAVEKKDRDIVGTLTLPTFHLDLPSDPGRGVQPLDDNPAVTILQPLGPKKEGRSPDALRYAIGIDLGKIEIASNVINLTLTKQTSEPLEIELRDKVRLTGGIAILSGKLSVVGKEFKIEHGLVRFPPKDVSASLDPLFRPETSNPYVNVRASWSGAPAGTRIYVDYVGLLNPITRQKLRFSADPALGDAQILAMLLGPTDASGATPSGGGPTVTQVVSGVAADFAAQQFNAALASALSGSVLQGLSAHLATNDDGTLRPALTYSLSDNLSAVASYAGSTAGAAPGAAGTTTAGSSATSRGARTVISLDWRFLPNWLIRSTFSFGDLTSSGIDLLWQYRY